VTHFFTLTPGTDNFTGLAGDYNEFHFTPSTLQSTDTVTGGATGSFLDILVATAGGTIASSQFAGVTLVEQLNLSGAGNNVTLSNGLVAGSNIGYFAVVDGGGSDNVDASAITTRAIVFFAGAGSDVFKGGGGNDAVFIAPADLSSADILQGGTGSDNLFLNAAGAVSASALSNVTGFEGISLSSSGNAVTLSNSLVAGASYFSVNDGGANDNVDASAVTTTPVVFFEGAGSDVFQGGGGNDAVYVAAADLTSADNLSGGGGIDNLYLTTPGTVAASAFTNVTGFEALVLNALGNNVTLTNGLVAGASNGTFAVADGAGSDTVDASGVTNGKSVVIFANSGADVFKGGNGLNAYAFAVADLTSADQVTGGSAVDNLIFTNAGTVAASAFTQVTGIEALLLANGANNVTLTNGLVAGTSIGYFAVVGGNNADIVDASGVTNGTAIVFNGTSGGNDNFTGGNGNDSFQFTAAQLTSADTVTGGGGADVLWMTAAGTTNTADLAGVTGIEGVYLQNGGTFHLANGITAAAGLSATGSAAVDNLDASAVTAYAVSFTGNGGADNLTGGTQNDTFFIADSAFASINGNGGTDRITLAAPAQSFNLTANAAKITNLEVIDLDSSLNSTLTLAGTDIATVNAGGNSLYVVGNVDDTVNAGNGWTQIASGVVNNAVAPGHTFYEYQHSTGSLLFIDTAITAVTATTGNGSANVPEGTAAGATVFDANRSGATTYVLGGADAALFSIDATGHISFNASPNFETPQDQGTNNVYDLTVTSSDGTATPNFVETVAITVTDVNAAPGFTSGTTGSEAENTPIANVVYDANATDDGENSNTLIYSLSAGGDNDRFNINASTGEVTFKVSPNFEAPADANTDNIYNITVHANDGTLDTPRAVTITVSDVNDNAPAFTSAAAPNVAENTTAVVTLTTTDSDTVGTNPATFSITGGADQGLFTITGGNQLAFTAARDFETQAHSYSVQVTANDGTNNTVQNLTVTLTDANDNLPVFTSSATPNVAENTTAVVALTTTDADTVGTNPATFSITGGADSALFTITGGNQLEFIAAPDFETQAHSYAVQVTANDGTNNTVQNLNVTLTDTNDNVPTFTSSATPTVFENNTAVVDLTTTDPDTVGTNPATFTITGGADQAKFTITGGNHLAFLSAPDFENPTDSGPDNVYDVQVTANDGTSNTIQNIAVTVADINEAPTLGATPTNPLYSPAADLFNAVTASTIESGQSIDQLVFTVSNVNDVDETMSIDGSTVALTDGTLVTPTTGNSMDVSVSVVGTTATVTISKSGGVAASVIAGIVDTMTYTDASTVGVTSRAFTITSLHDTGGTANGGNPTGTPNVTSTVAFNQAPVIDAPANADTYATSVAENTTAVTTVHATDPDTQPNPNVSYSIVAGFEDAANFSIDSSSGVLTFSSAPDFENPTDTATSGNNTYIVKVRASDGASFDEQTITVTVTNVNEAPTANPDAASVTEAGGAGNGTAGVDITAGFNAVTGTGAGSVADTDPENDTLTVAGAAAGTQAGPLNTGVNTNLSGAGANNFGTFKIQSDGSFTYTVNQTNAAVQGLRQPGDTLTDTFSYTISDGNAHTSTTTVTVTIHGQDDNPVGNADNVSVTEAGGTANATAGIDITGFTFNAITGAGTGTTADTDVDTGDTLKVVAVSDGNHLADPQNVIGNIGAGISDNNNHGSLTFQNTGGGQGDGTFNYVVNQNNTAVQALDDTGATITDTYTYKVQDLAGGSSVALLNVTIHGKNDAPDITSDGGLATATVHANENQTAVTTVTYTDPEIAQTHSFAIVAGNDGAKFSINGSGVLTFNAAPNFEVPTDANTDGDYVVQVKVTDNGTGSLFDTQTITVHVDNVNDAPVAADHTYNLANGGTAAIANTSLVLDNGTGGSPVDPAGPQKTISGSLTDGATDEDGATTFAVTAGTFATNQGGSVTITADGDFTYRPAAGFTGNDTFTYTLTDQAAVNPLTDTGLVTINVATPKVWYVNADAAVDGDGTSDNPFNTLTHFQNSGVGNNVDGAGDTIFLYNAVNHYTGLSTLTLESNEKLIGQDVGLIVNGTTLEAATGVNGAIIDGGVVLNGAATGNTISGVTLGNTGVGGTALSGTGFGTLTIDNTVVNTNNNGMVLSTGAFAAGAAFTSFTSSGATDVSLTGITGSVDLGTGAMAGLFAVSGGSVNTTYSGSLSQATNAAMVSVTGAHTGTMTFTGALTATNGTGLQFDNADGSYNFNGTNTLSNTVGGATANAGVDIINGSNGNFSFSSNSSITGQTSNTETAFNVAGAGAGNITYAGTIGSTGANDNAGTSVSINGHTGGTVAFTGNILDSGDSGGGIGISTNANTTINFSGIAKTLNTTIGDGVSISGSTGTTSVNFTNGGLDIDTTNGSGFLAAGGAVTVSGSGNAINVTGTGRIIEMSGVSLGAGGANFDTLQTTGTVSNNSAILLSDVNSNTFNGGAVSIAGTSGATSDGIRIDGTSSATFNFSSATISNTGDDGIDLNSGNGTVTFTTVNINGTGGAGIETTLNSNPININGGSIGFTNDPAGVGVDINGGGADITINPTIAKTTAGHVVEVSTRTNGTVDFNGNITSNTSGGGIDLNGNTGGTVRFDGGMTLSTGANAAFNSSGGNTGASLVITDPAGATNNTLTTVGGTALNVANTTIGVGGLVFEKISANGGNNGIVLNNTGATAGLTVTGDGSTAGSGGVIQNMTGADDSSATPVGTGIVLNNTKSVSLNWMNLHDFSNYGVNGTNVTGFIFDHSVIGGSNGTNVNSPFRDSSMTFDNLLGTAVISNSNISGGVLRNIEITNTSGSLDLTVNNNNIHDTGKSPYTGGLEGDDNLYLGNQLTANIAAHITNNTFSQASGDHFNGDLSGSGTVSYVITGNHYSDTLSGGRTTLLGGGFFILGAQWNGTFTYNISNNGDAVTPLTGDNSGGAIVVNKGSGTGSFSGTIQNNWIGNPAVTGSGSLNAAGIQVEAHGSGSHTTLIDGNHVRQFHNSGIELIGGEAANANSSDLKFDATITNNIVSNPDNISGASGHGIHINMGTLPTDKLTATLKIETNTLTGAGEDGDNGTLNDGQFDLRIRERQSAAVIVNISGLGANSANIDAYETGKNTLTTVATSAVATFTAFAGNPATAAHPTLVAAAGQGPGSPDVLTYSMLAPIVAQAIQYWADAGASAAQLALLDKVGIGIDNLADGVLGQTVGTAITVDVNGAGWGWFVDPTPSENSEFGHTHSATELAATAGEASGHMDLLTVIEHELGHVLGLEHSQSAGDVMDDSLDVGIRRMASADDVTQAEQSNIVSAAQTAEAALPDSAAAPAGTTIVPGTAGNDTFNISQGGAIIAGGAGADTFVFKAPVLATSMPTTHIADYHAAEGDTFDFSAITSEFHNSSVSDSLVVRAVEDASGKFATLQVDHIDPMGLPSAPNWVNVAQLDGAHAGDTVNVLIDNHSVHLAQIHVDFLV
jgi:VCBS repeat-containing protein